jgi:hypothetical protein
MATPLRNARARLAIVVAITAVVGGTALAGIAAGDEVTTDFEQPDYATGTVDNQQGWESDGAAGSGCAVYDHEVDTNGTTGGTGFGDQSLRASNSVTSGCFGDQTFSAALAEAAGETAAEGGAESGSAMHEYFEAAWQFASVTGLLQDGLSVVASPDRGDGARMSWVQMADDSASGLQVNFYDYQASLDVGCTTGDGFVFTPLVDNLDRSVPHDIRLTMLFVDGPGNDVVEVYVDGVKRHTGTSWEDYFRDCEGNETRTVDSLLFRTGGGPVASTAGAGFYIDNIRLFSGSQPPAPDLEGGGIQVGIGTAGGQGGPARALTTSQFPYAG